MYAEAVDRASLRLRELHHEEWGDAAIAAVAFGLALLASRLRPSFAVPLVIGGLVLAALAIRTLFRHWAFVDQLLDERDAYVIPEVRARAERSATLERRRSLATSFRIMLDNPGLRTADRITRFGSELSELASELEDEDLALDPFCAVTCERLVLDLDWSPLLNSALPAEDLRSRVRQVRAGFRRRT
jgi:hypothetical protein